IAGHPAGAVPPEYVGGLGEAGVNAIKAFVEGGGTLICLDQSAGLAIGSFKLPVRDIAHEAASDKFYCPGSILRIEIDPSQPLAYGMVAHAAGFFGGSSAYEIIGSGVTTAGSGRDGGPGKDGGSSSGPNPAAGESILTVARYADKDVLASGWLEGEQVI